MLRAAMKNIDAVEDYKILIIDDAASMRSVEKDCLKDFGFVDIQEAVNGKDALKKIESRKFDLILCDWDMPEMDGLTLLKNIRSQWSEKELPFIMVTGNATPDYVRSAIKEGINDFMVKPVQIKVLKEKVFAVLGSVNEVESC